MSIFCRLTQPGRTRIGTESEKAWATPANAFSLPGPACMVATPKRFPLVTRLNPSAMLMSVRSVRVIIGRMSILAAASISVLAGKQNRYSTPSNFNILATASTLFICDPS